MAKSLAVDLCDRKLRKRHDDEANPRATLGVPVRMTMLLHAVARI
jgi:hypothetical protein